MARVARRSLADRVSACVGLLALAVVSGEGATIDGSEQHLRNTRGVDLHHCADGGHQWLSTAYLARWGGPAYGSDSICIHPRFSRRTT